MNWDIAKMIFLGASGYIIIGSLTVLIASYFSAIGGGHFFKDSSDRWTNDRSGMSALAIFIGWPVMVPMRIIYYLGKGWKRALEYLADKAIESGQMREKKLRGGDIK